MKKSILFVVHSMGMGGVENVLANIANGLVNKGYKVHIVVTSNKIENLCLLDKRISVLHKEEPQYCIIRKLPYFKNFCESGVWTKRHDPKTVYKHFIGHNDYDVEVAFFFGRPVKAIFGSSNQKSKKIYWCHSDYNYCNGLFAGFKTKEEGMEAYNNFDNIVCQNEYIKDSLEKIIGKKDNIKIIRNLINTDKILKLSKEKINLEKKNFTFVTVGRLSEEKAYIRVLESVNKLNKLKIVFSFWIIGDGPEKEKLENYIKENNLFNVKLLGKQSNPYAYMKQADAFICSSIHEADSLTVAESMILDIPVISSDCIGPRSILENGKYGILTENSSNGIFNGMKKILEDKEVYTNLIKLTKERKAIFDYNTILNQIEDLIND